MHKSFAFAEVKAADTTNPNGEFDIVMSTDSLDRDGEIVAKGAFEPLPESLPVHAFHDFRDPIGRVVPQYDAKGRLIGHGYFASTPRAQEIRQLVADGVIGHTSVGFMNRSAQREGGKNGEPVVMKSAELIELSFVSIPANRDAAVLAVKYYEAKAGSRNSTKDGERLQTIHDLAVANGANCEPTTNAPEAPGEEPGKSPASRHVVQKARLMADYYADRA